MDISIIVIRTVGLMYLAMSVGVLVGQVDLKKLYEDIMKSSGLKLLMGMMAVILGMIVITYHNVWTGGWVVLITLIGWLALIKGLFVIAFPKTMDVFDPVFKGTFVKILPYFTLVFGLIFVYWGFFAQI